MEWLLIICVLTGAFLNIRKNWRGFVLWIIADSVFCLKNFAEGSYAESACFFLYVIFAVMGMIAWRSDSSI